MATITWRGGSGNWSSGLNWSLFQPPQAGDEVFIAASGSYVVTVDVVSFAQDIFLADSGATLDVASTLTLGGTLSIGDGTALVLSGTIVGGTIDSASGVDGQFGTLDGTALTGGGGAASLSDVTITTATAAANAGTTLQIGASVGLAAGTYDSTSFVLDVTQGGAGTELVTAGTAAVTFGAATTVDLLMDASVLTFPPAGGSAMLSGAGSMDNLGTITSNDSNQFDGTLEIAVAAFTNDNLMTFAPLLLAEEGTFIIGYQQFAHGSVPIEGVLDWTQGYGETLSITSAQFTNNQTLSVAGGTLDLDGGQFTNSGTVTLSDVVAQQITADAQGVTSVIDETLATQLDVSAATAFSNTGTISADSIVFDGSVALAALGTLQGTLAFDGTLDLGGGTLEAGQFPQVTFAGLVKNGTVAGGVLVLDSATLDNVVIAPGGSVQSAGPITLIDPPASVTSLTLDATTTELQ